MNNKLLKQSNIKGTFQLDFYPVTQWSAIVDAPSFEGNDGKILNVSGGQLSWTGIKTINGKSLFGDGNIEIIGTGTQSNWNINDTEDPAYIFNRTHYIEQASVVCNITETSGDFLENGIYMTVITDTDPEPEWPSSVEELMSAIIGLAFNGIEIPLGDLRSYIIEGDVIWYYGNLSLVSFIGGGEGEDLPDTGEDFLVFITLGITFLGNASVYGDTFVSGSITVNQEMVHKLDNKFLNDIPTSKINGLATVATTNDYYSLDNLPTIPSLGTLQTNIETALTPSASESFSNALQLHKISKTGSYNDLLNKPIIPEDRFKMMNHGGVWEDFASEVNNMDFTHIYINDTYIQIPASPDVKYNYFNPSNNYKLNIYPYSYLIKTQSNFIILINRYSEGMDCPTFRIDKSGYTELYGAFNSISWFMKDNNSLVNDVEHVPSSAAVLSLVSNFIIGTQVPSFQTQADWNESDTTAPAYINNKPTIPDAQIQSDWSQSDNTKLDYIKNKPTIPSVTGKADKVSGATNGNLAGLDSNGNLTDSGVAKGILDKIPSTLGTAGQILQVNSGVTALEFTTPAVVHGIPAGGNAGQVLKKTSATDYDANWANASETLPSAYCTTSGSTAAKKANCSLYVTQANQYLQVLISSANTYQGALTLNINSAGAKPVYINGTASSSSNYTLPNGTYFVFYDGTNYYFRTDGKLPMKDAAFGGSYNDLADKPATIPTPTSADENKLLSVDSNGAYVLVTVLNSENIAY